MDNFVVETETSDEGEDEFASYEGEGNLDLLRDFQGILEKKNNIKEKFYIKCDKKKSQVWIHIGFLYTKNLNKKHFGSLRFCKPCFDRENWV